MHEPALEPQGDDGTIGRAARGSLAAVIALGVIGTGVWLLVRKPAPVREADPTPVTPAVPRVVDRPLTAVPFTDIAKAAGIDFVHTTGATGEYLLPETMGGGVGFLDVDADGDQDLVLIDGCRWQGEPFASEPEPGHDSVRLWTNDGRGQFREATQGSGLEGPRYGMGVAIGDLDGDGRTDLFVTAVGRNAVYLNRTEQGGAPRFEDATDRLNVPHASRWGTSAAMFDGDQDGDLDVIVCNYVRWSREIDLAVDYRLTGIGRAYGSPTGFEGVDLTYLRNDGAAGLVDATAESGFAVANASTGRPVGKALGWCSATGTKMAWSTLRSPTTPWRTSSSAMKGLRGVPGSSRWADPAASPSTATAAPQAPWASTPGGCDRGRGRSRSATSPTR